MMKQRDALGGFLLPSPSLASAGTVAKAQPLSNPPFPILCCTSHPVSLYPQLREAGQGWKREPGCCWLVPCPIPARTEVTPGLGRAVAAKPSWREAFGCQELGCAAWLLPSPCWDKGGDYTPLDTWQGCLGERTGLGMGAILEAPKIRCLNPSGCAAVGRAGLVGLPGCCVPIGLTLCPPKGSSSPPHSLSSPTSSSGLCRTSPEAK